MASLTKDEEIALLKHIISLLPGHIYVKDKNGVYLLSNDQQAKTLGYFCGEDLVGKTDMDLPWHKEAANLQKVDQEVMKSGTPFEIEELVTLPGSREAIFLSKKAALTSINGEVLGILGVSIDITDRKKIEVIEREAREFAEKAARFMETTAGAIAHELSTPLAIVNMQMDYLAAVIEKGKLDTNQSKLIFKQTIGNVKDIVKSAAYIISNILIKMRSLVIGKIDKLDFKDSDIVTGIKNVLSVYPFGSNEKNLIEFQSTNGFKYFGSKMLTEHMLFNLLKNALRAIKQAGHGEIIIKLENRSEYNTLIFIDTALGISKEFLPKIFDQFETKEKHGKGCGLGLAFCKLVMESYDGNITCKSKEGEYTEFVLSFPKIQPQMPTYGVANKFMSK